MGKPFARIHASSVGTFDQRDRVPQWLKANGGQFSRNVDSRITHLIASLDAWENNAEAVQKAKELGTVKIVTFDWLEDSLLQKSRRPKPEEPYLLENQFGPKVKKRKKDGQGKKQNPRDPFAQKRVAKFTRSGPKVRDRIYTDPDTNEEWAAYLVRLLKPGGSREKFSLGIFETLNKRPSYSVYLKYSRTGTSNVQVLAPPRSNLEHAKAVFRKFFVQETGKEWEDRLNNQAPPPKRDVNGKDLPLHEGWYSIEFKKSTILGTYMAEPAQKPAPAESQSVIPGQSNIAV